MEVPDDWSEIETGSVKYADIAPRQLSQNRRLAKVLGNSKMANTTEDASQKPIL